MDEMTGKHYAVRRFYAMDAMDATDTMDEIRLNMNDMDLKKS